MKATAEYVVGLALAVIRQDGENRDTMSLNDSTTIHEPKAIFSASYATPEPRVAGITSLPIKTEKSCALRRLGLDKYIFYQKAEEASTLSTKSIKKREYIMYKRLLRISIFSAL